MKKYFRDRVRSLFQLNDPPHDLALAFALGVFIGFTPTIGLHTISCLVLAWMLRLRKLVVLTASLLINNPWTIVPLYGSSLWFGLAITGSSIITPHIAWNELTFTNAYLTLKPYIWSFIVGTIAAGIVSAIASYFVIYWAVLRYRRVERKDVVMPSR